MEDRRSPDSQAVGLMVLFCFILGMQQIVLKAAADDVAPILQIAIRSGIAALFVWLYMVSRGETVSLKEGKWKAGLLMGVLFGLEYLFMGEALRFTTASHTVVFLYTAPVFAALILHFLLPTERMNSIQWIGIAMAFSGTALAFIKGDQGEGLLDVSDMLLGDMLAMLGGVAWGLTTVVIRMSAFSRVSPRETLLYQLVLGSLLLFVGAVVSGQLAFTPSALAVGSIVFQSIFVAFLAFLIWFWLLRNYHSSPIGIMSFMTPIFGVFLGAFILSEPLEPDFLIGSVLVIVGVILVSGERWVRQSVKRWRSVDSRT